ncbi:fibronectin type III domain-containing protein [Listeria floridensis FSL S10-1187]|uniref:Fibronectin type III domain-containing protein n=1 Tax=Listeria floridensis FSL S10-1187 TaxID=1265817 RepID=A0ABP3AZP3_9LIST|nr:Ig-like domain-containing protein [Listeria floridensis]EUJ31274.1 fibronectin type III domain-containing protein [Listeria floridensis FSL S10-1187]
MGVFVLMFMILGGANTVSAAGAPSIYITPTNSTKADIVTMDWSPIITPPYTYWAVHNWNQGGEGGGYAGFQQKTGTTSDGLRTVHFAIWDPIAVSSPILAEYMLPNATTSLFGGEGTGRNVATPYKWDNNEWYTMTMRAWQENGRSKFGQWVRDNQTGVWEQIAVLDFPVASVYFNYGSLMFQEDWWNTPDALRSARIKNGYNRNYQTKSWVSWNSQKVASQAKNASNWDGGATSEYFWFQSGGNQDSSIGSGKVFTINQPAMPDRGQIKFDKIQAKYEAGQLDVLWKLENTSSPQFKAAAYIKDKNQNIVKTITDIKSYQSTLSESLTLGNDYTLTLQVTDIFDQTASFSVPIEMGKLDITPPTITLDPIRATYTVVTGKTEAGAKVEVYVNGNKIGEGVAATDGSYSVVIPKQAVGTTVKAIAIDESGNESEAVSQVVKGRTFVSTPMLNSISDKDAVLTGESELFAGIEVRIEESDGSTWIKTGETDQTGTFSIDIGKWPAGTKIDVYTVVEEVYSDKATVTVTDKTAPDMPSVDPVTSNDTLVKGQAEANSLVQISVNGNKIAEGNADASGKFSLIISAQKAGTILSVTATDAAGNTSEAKTTTVSSAALAAPVVKPVGDSDMFVEGTATPGALVELIIPHESGGYLAFEGTADSDGKFKIAISKQKVGTVISAVAKKGTLTSPKSTLTVTDNTPPEKATIDPLTEDSTIVSGTAEPYATVIVYDTFGNMITAGGADGNGRYQVVISKQVVNSVIQVAVMDKAGNMSERVSQTVLAAPLLTPTVNEILDTDTAVSGTAAPNASIELAIPRADGGVLTYSGKADTDGKYSISIVALQAGAKVEVTASLNGKKSDKVTAIVRASAKADYSLTVPAGYTIGSSTIKGTFGKDVFRVRLWVNGKVVTQAVTDALGNYTINNAAQYISKKTDLVEIVGVDSGYAEKIRKAVTVEGEEAADFSLTVPTSYKLGSSTLTGKFGQDIFRVRLWVNGKVVAQATTNSSGTYTFSNVEKYITSASDKVEIVGVDSRYAEQVRETVAVENNTFNYALTVSQNPYEIGASTSITGTIGKDLWKVRLKVNGTIVAQAMTDALGNYTFTNAAQFIASASDVVEIVAVDTQYVQRASISVAVKQSGAEIYALTANPYKLNQADLTGTFGKGIAKVRLFVNGIVQKQAVTDTAGNFKFTSIASFIKAGDKVELVGVDSRYVEQARIEVVF